MRMQHGVSLCFFHRLFLYIHHSNISIPSPVSPTLFFFSRSCYSSFLTSFVSMIAGSLCLFIGSFIDNYTYIFSFSIFIRYSILSIIKTCRSRLFKFSLGFQPTNLVLSSPYPISLAARNIIYIYSYLADLYIQSERYPYSIDRHVHQNVYWLATEPI